MKTILSKNTVIIGLALVAVGGLGIGFGIVLTKSLDLTTQSILNAVGNFLLITAIIILAMLGLPTFIQISNTNTLRDGRAAKARDGLVKLATRVRKLFGKPPVWAVPISMPQDEQGHVREAKEIFKEIRKTLNSSSLASKKRFAEGQVTELLEYIVRGTVATRTSTWLGV